MMSFAASIIMDDLIKELRRAEQIHPDWPEDLIHAAAIVSEEAGELVKAANQGDKVSMKREAIHTGAMVIRFLKAFMRE